MAVVTLRFPEPLQTRLRERVQALGFRIVEPSGPTQLKDALAQAHIALLHGDASADCLNQPKLRWIHCGHAGLEAYLPEALLAGRTVVTSAAGRSGPALAEHALFLMMALAYDHAGLSVMRRWRQWSAPPVARRRALCGRTLGVIGAGHVGSTLARYAHALGMQVLCWRRNPNAPPPAGVAHAYSAANGDSLESMLSCCEFLVLACSLNAATRHLIGRAQLAALPRGAFLVNVARGGLVDEPALIAALRSGQLAGAGLDVVAAEPLSATSPLWTMPQVLLSPHSTPRLADREARHLALIETNLDRFVAGLPLFNALTLADAMEPTAQQPRSLYQRVVSRTWRELYRWFHPRQSAS